MCSHVSGPVVLDLGAVQHDPENADTDEWLHAHLYDVPGVERVVGVDILESAVEKLNAAGYEFVTADVERMDLDLTADTVVVGELIEHVANPGLMLERIGEHLHPAGRVILTTPNPWAVVHLRRWLQQAPRINDEHVAWYGPIVLEQLLERYGFRVESITSVGPDHGGLTWLAKRTGYDIFGGTAWVCVAEVNGGHQQNVPDGAGCVEIWEHQSGVNE